MSENYIIHFGIKRKSGRYPWGSGKRPHQSEEKGDSREDTNTQNEEKKEPKKKFHLSNKQKTAIKIGVGVVGAALLAYGGYRLVKSGKLDSLKKVGYNIINRKPSIDVPSSLSNKSMNPESIKEALSKTNPLRGTLEGRNNCTHCAVAGFLRTNGINVTAKSSMRQAKDLGNVIEDCFENSKVLRGNASIFGKSADSAKNMLVRRFGNNAQGVVGVDWKGLNNGHAFNWVIKDGKVSFLDFKTGKEIGSEYWNLKNGIDPNGGLILARLDGLKVKDFVKNIVK